MDISIVSLILLLMGGFILAVAVGVGLAFFIVWFIKEVIWVLKELFGKVGRRS